MENKVVLIKYADGDEYHLTIEYLQDVAAARKRASELLTDCAIENNEEVDKLSISETTLFGRLTDGTLVWIAWAEMVNGGMTYINFSSEGDGYCRIIQYADRAKAIEGLKDSYLFAYKRLCDSIISAELSTDPYNAQNLGDFGKNGYYGYIVCYDEDVDAYWKLIENK